MERHQKTLLSDEFGMGFAGLFAERVLGAPSFIDVEFALANPTKYFNAKVHKGLRTRPDYLMWGDATPIFVVEAKGSQTRWNAVLTQLCRAMEQLPSIVIPGSTPVQLVTATFLERKRTRLLVLDPPDEQEESSEKVQESEERDESRFTPRYEDQRYTFKDERTARTKMQAGVALQLLRWVSQHQTARHFEESIDANVKREVPENAARTTIETAQGEFVGVRVPLVPELDPAGPRLFRGVRREVLEALDKGDPTAVDGLKTVAVKRADDDPRLSVGPLGTCLLIEGIDL